MVVGEDRTQQLDPNDPRYSALAGALLDRHRRNEAEANITSALRDFLTGTGLVERGEIVEENPPSDTSRRAVDLTALDTFIEVKKRVGLSPAGGLNPNPDYIQQLDDYLEQSNRRGKARMGVLTDGKYWLLRWPGAGPVKLTPPDAFTLEPREGLVALYEWLRDFALEVAPAETLDRENITRHFGPDSPKYRHEIALLRALYGQYKDSPTVQVKRQLWHDLLLTALGEIAETEAELDDLFIRHTYLSAAVGMVVQASFGLDLRQVAANDSHDLLYGRQFQNRTGLNGIIESDFFTWPAEVGGLPFLRTLAHRIAKFNWRDAPANIGAVLYESIIPAEERRQLGEYYTPHWLARTMVKELIDDPLNQQVLDPSCGSGTFLAEAIAHFISAAMPEGGTPKEHPHTLLRKLRANVTGIDIHPVAVHLARAAWTLAARPVIQAAAESGYSDDLPIPVYLGDALQLRYRVGDMFSENSINLQVEGSENIELVFPRSLVERPEQFDALMVDVAAAIERGYDPLHALSDHHITDGGEKAVLAETIAAMQELHRQGRNHIWAYYVRNMVRPVVLAQTKVDALVGNPPWLNYRSTKDVLRAELVNLSRNTYGIWAGGRYATHQDVAGLFFTRSVDLYLKDNGVIGFVLPHSALQSGQHSQWRTGKWQRNKTAQLEVHVDFTFKRAWDLEKLEPNTFFPVAADAVFARKLFGGAEGKALTGTVEQWLGPAGSQSVRRVAAGITDTGARGQSFYEPVARQGASIVPRCLFFVEETENTAVIQAGNTIPSTPVGAVRTRRRGRTWI